MAKVSHPRHPDAALAHAGSAAGPERPVPRHRRRLVPETVGQNLHTLSELAELLIEKYQTTNPRLLGNLLAYCAGSHAALRAVLRGGILFILILAAAKNINRLTPIPVLLTFTALLVLPQAMFAQVYPWAAGFSIMFPQWPLPCSFLSWPTGF